ncbi:glutathione S-transferase family protein [Antarcticirhabdus aurantiaca]|uniref:Glutathione S-transferase family protein n=1 Tax=Antarcticirhabdus aurantiaca TaxID=2606717 RepID=A0ACD4NMU5_9HYPH|nr:glutathione S-transferase family protein [Antarcticirhabdus aurantiaca]WAJ28285.1 glutathione S-transferase family protein [Jeongeuplla avenae]
MPVALYDLVGSDTSRPFSPHCWKVRMALLHKGLAFESIPTTFTAIPAIENGASSIVPVIRDGDAVVSDSFAIAEYLERAYPDRPTLFGGEGGQASARFVEAYANGMLHPLIAACAVPDIHDMLGPADQAYCRQSREKRFGQRLEALRDGRAEAREALGARLGVVRDVLKRQPFLGGEAPLFADYIVFSALQWARVTTSFKILAVDDPVLAWFERCLDLHGGAGRSVSEAPDREAA